MKLCYIIRWTRLTRAIIRPRTLPASSTANERFGRSRTTRYIDTAILPSYHHGCQMTIAWKQMSLVPSFFQSWIFWYPLKINLKNLWYNFFLNRRNAKRITVITYYKYMFRFFMSELYQYLLKLNVLRCVTNLWLKLMSVSLFIVFYTFDVFIKIFLL